jgi:hypothetical protein
MAKLPEEIKPCCQGAIPSVLATCSASGEPNVAVISQVYWVDDEHVALSFQFFNKTIRNIRENPRAAVRLVDPSDFTVWSLDLEFVRSESDGPTFEAMDMQLEAIASMTGMTGIFKLKAADIYHVLNVRKRPPVF